MGPSIAESVMVVILELQLIKHECRKAEAAFLALTQAGRLLWPSTAAYLPLFLWSQIKKRGSVVHFADMIRTQIVKAVGCPFVDGTAIALGAIERIVGTAVLTMALGKLLGSM